MLSLQWFGRWSINCQNNCGGSAPRRTRLRVRELRQLHSKRRALATPRAFRPHRTSVELDEMPDDGEAKTEAAVPAAHRPIRLPEAIKDVRQKRRIDPAAGVAYLQSHEAM